MTKTKNRMLAGAGHVCVLFSVAVLAGCASKFPAPVADRGGPSASATVAPAPISNTYTVKAGDTVYSIAREHGKSSAQVMLRWHLQQGRSVIPKSTKPARIAENFDVFDFELSTGQVAEIDALDTGIRSGPEPGSITLENYGHEIAEA